MYKIKGLFKREEYQNYLYIVLLLLLFIGCSVFIGHIYGNLFMDCGREAILPELMLKGKVLYKDIFGMYNPLSYQINTCLYYVFGRTLNTLYGSAYINAFLLILGIYFISRKFISGYYSFCISFLIMSLYIFGSTGIVSYLYPYAFAFPYAVTFFTYSVYCFLNYIQSHNKRDLYISAFLMGLSFANKPEFLLCIIPVLFVIHSMKENIKSYIVYLLLCSLPVIISYGVLFIQGFTFNDIINYIIFNINFFNSQEQLIYTSGYVFTPISEYSLKIVFENFIFLFIMVTGIACYIAISKKNTFLKWFVILYFPLVLYFLYNALYQNFQSNYFSWITFALLATMYFYAADKRKEQRRMMFLFLATSGLLSMIRINFMPIYKWSCAIYMLLPVVAVWIYFVEFDSQLLQKINYKLYISLSLLIICIVNIFVIKNFDQPVIKLRTSKGNIIQKQSDAQMFQNLSDWITKYTDKNESVLVLPEGAMLNFITERPVNPMYYHLIPNHITALGEDNIIKGLKADMPKYIIMTNVKYDMYGKQRMCYDYGIKICEFINENYSIKENYSVPQSTGEPFEAKILRKN